MKAFQPYVDHLQLLLSDAVKAAGQSGYASTLDAALDGQASELLRSLIPLERLQEAGAYFTGSDLAKRALYFLLKTIKPESIILDPACGAGDLLIKCASRLPTASTLGQTLSLWEDHLIGRDLHPEFIRAAKVRLSLAAIRRGVTHSKSELPEIEDLLPQIEKRCGLTDLDAFASASHIVINPPFTLMDAPHDCNWASGVVNSAALFLEACLMHARVDTRIVAIMPDVLRSGSRYKKWREFVQSRMNIQRIDLYGKFDKWTDVDVFIIEGHVTDHNGMKRDVDWKYPKQSSTVQLSDHFDISVGSVVTYRDPHEGPWFPFIYPSNLPAWKTIDDIPEHRRFSGRTFDPPFVVVRRTSSPSDRYRAVGTIINGSRPVAVENHLLVLQPKDSNLNSCECLLSILYRPETNTWLNQRIRCRHLTVSSLQALPWDDER